MSWIDYRSEMGALFNGEIGSVGQSHWILFRMSNMGVLSKYWDPRSQSAINGPKYEGIKFLIKAIDTPVMVPNTMTDENIGSPGNVDSQRRIFAIEWSSIFNNPIIANAYKRIPNEEDEIYVFENDHGNDKPKPPYKILKRYKIYHVEPVKGDTGQIELLYLYGKVNWGSN